MKQIRKMLALALAVVMALSVSVTGFAAAYSTPAEAAAGVTGKTLEEVLAERATGKTFGTIAKDAGKLEEFKDAVLEIKKERLEELVKAGSITQADADEILAIIKERQAICDGTGNAGGGLGLGMGRGTGRGASGAGAGRGAGRGAGGRGIGGMGLRDGSCYR